MTSDRPTLALDVDGVLLDPDRDGDGRWTNELERRYGISEAQLRDAFFASCWEDVVNGRRPIEAALGEALRAIGTSVAVEDVLDCWFEADFVPIDESIALARQAAAAGVRVVLATDQERRRAAYLTRRMGALFPLTDVVASAGLGVQKHDLRFFELASAQLGVERRRDVVFVDDVEINVERAAAAGWRACWAHPGRPWRDEVSDALGIERHR